MSWFPNEVLSFSLPKYQSSEISKIKLLMLCKAPNIFHIQIELHKFTLENTALTFLSLERYISKEHMYLYEENITVTLRSGE